MERLSALTEKNFLLKEHSSPEAAKLLDRYIKDRFPKSPITGKMIVEASRRLEVPAEYILAFAINDSSL